MKGWLLRNPGKMDDPSILKIMKVVEESKIDLTIVDPQQIHMICDQNFDGKIYVGNEIMDLPDYVVAAFFTEKNYHTHSVLKMLESVGVLCINNYDCIKNADDKLLSFQKIAESIEGIRLPKTMLVTPHTEASLVSQLFSYPLVMKVIHGSKGKGVVLVNSEKELDNIINMITSGDLADQVLIQECIVNSSGRDLRIIISSGKYVKAFVRQNEENFRSNLAKGGHILEYEPSESLIQTAEEIAKLLKINMGSVDFLFGEDDTFYFCEANAMPGVAFDIQSMFNDLVKQIQEKPEPLWKKRMRERKTLA